MADVTTVTNLDIIRFGTEDVPIVRLAEPSAAGSTSLVFDSPITDETGAAPSNAMLIAFEVSGKVLECYIAAGGFTSTTAATITTRQTKRGGLDITTADTANDFDLPSGTPVKSSISALWGQQVVSALQGAIGSTIKLSTPNSFNSTGILQNRVFADATARDAAIVSPSNGQMCYLTDTGVMYQYIGGAWTTYATGTTSNGSETVAGKVELATNAEMGTSTSTGGTGARLVPPNDQLVQASSGAGDANKLATLGSTGKFANGFIQVGTSLTAGENLTAGNAVAVESDGSAWKTIRSADAFAQMGSITNASALDCAYLTDDTEVVIYNSTTPNLVGAVITYSRRTPTAGTPVTIDAGVNLAGRVAALSSTKFVAVYSNNDDANKIYGTVCTVSGTVITAGTPVKLYDTEAVDALTYDVCKIDTDKFLVVFRNATSDDPLAVACTVSGTVITAGTSSQLEATTMAGAARCAQISTDKAIAIYDDGTNISSMILSVSGTTITTNTATDMYAGSMSWGSGIFVIDAERIYVWNNLTNGITRISILTNSDKSDDDDIGYNSVGDFTITSQVDATGAFSPKIAYLGNDLIGVASAVTTDDTVIFRVLKLGYGGAVTVFDSGAISGNTNVDDLCVAKLNSTFNKAVIFSRDSGATDAIKESVYLDTSDQFVGVVQTTTSAASSVPIISGKDATVSGLTAGTVYYVGDAGAVATTGVRRIGTATTTSNLYLN
jgi:hypothetical protein